MLLLLLLLLLSPLNLRPKLTPCRRLPLRFTPCRWLPLRLTLQPRLRQAPRLYLPLPLLVEPMLQLRLLLQRLLSLPGLHPRREL